MIDNDYDCELFLSQLLTMFIPIITIIIITILNQLLLSQLFTIITITIIYRYYLNYQPVGYLLLYYHYQLLPITTINHYLAVISNY